MAKLQAAIQLYNDAVLKYRDAVMAEHAGCDAVTAEYSDCMYYLIRAEAIEDTMRIVYELDEDFRFVNCRKPYSDGKRDFIYKLMMEVL